MTQRVLVVDYLGRGGIAQAAFGYTSALGVAGHSVKLITRRDREIPTESAVVRGIPSPGLGRPLWHAAVVAATVREIRITRPEVVIVQNYWAPWAELPIVWAAHGAGAWVMLVLHNHIPHARGTGIRGGLNRLIRSSDLVVAHSEYVARHARRVREGIGVRVLPLPDPLSLASEVGEGMPPIGPRRALCFGVLSHSYKGAALVRALAREGVSSWVFRLVGVGAGQEGPNVSTRPEFVGLSDLATEIGAASAVLLPYRAATQSAAIRLTQALGRVAVASAVGGIPEQIVHGVDGLLIPEHARLSSWRAVLESLTPEDILRIGSAARRRAIADDTAFSTGIARLVESNDREHPL